MIGRGIATMDSKTILRELPVEFLHDPVAGHLGQDTCGGNTQTEAISPDESSLIHGKPLCGESIHQGMSGRMSLFFQSIQGSLHRQMSCPQDIQVTDFLRTGLCNSEADVRIFSDRLKQPLPLRMVEFLGVVQSV